MITKITFDTIEITSVASDPYNIIDDNGFEPSSSSNYSDIPRTNYRQYISAYNTPAVRSITYLFKGSDRSNFIESVEDFYKYEQTIQTFDVFMEEFAGGSGSTVIHRQFEGLIESIRPINKVQGKIDYGDFEMRITSTNRYLRDPSTVTKSAGIQPGGFVFPYIYGYTYAGATNTVTVTNTGTADAFPVFTLTGGGQEWTIQTDNTNVDNQNFVYTGSIPDNVNVVIDPSPVSREKALSNGISVIQNTNFNWEALVVPAGETVTFTTTIQSGFTSNTLLSISFNPLYKY